MGSPIKNNKEALAKLLELIQALPKQSVTSVNGKTGEVALSPSDLQAAAVDHKHDANNDITSGILPVARGGTGQGGIADGVYNVPRFRASTLNSTASNPTTNGVINWTYE